jgi:hypothetical protein
MSCSALRIKYQYGRNRQIFCENRPFRMKEMIRAAYTRLWEFRTRTRIALTKDIRQRHAPRRSKRKKIRPLKCRAKAFSRSSAPFTHKNEKAAGRLLDPGGFRR